MRRFAVVVIGATALLGGVGCDLVDFLSLPTQQEANATARILEAETACDDVAVAIASAGGTSSGALSTGDCRLGDGSYADFWLFQTTAQGRVTVEVEAAGFAPYVAVAPVDLANGETGNGLDDADTDEDGTARVEGTLTAGLWVVFAGSVAPGETGPYTLRIRREAAE